MKKKFYLKNLLLFIIPTLIPILILGTFAILISNNFNNVNFSKSNSALLKQMKENVELMLNELDTVNLNFDYNIDVAVPIKGILESPTYSLEEYKISQMVKNFISSPANSKPFIHSMYVYFNNSQGRFISSANGINSLDNSVDTSWYKSFRDKESDVNWWSEIRNISHYEFQPETPVISIYKKIYSPGMNNANGVIVLNIYLSYIEKMLEDLVTFKEQSLLVLDENNRVLFGSKHTHSLTYDDLITINNNSDPFFTYKSRKNFYAISKLESKRYGWKYISIVPNSSFNQITTRLRLLTFALLLLSLLLVLVLAYYLTKKNYSNINKIIAIIDSAENQHPLPPLPDPVKDEYSYIIHNILNTFMKHSYLKLQLSERKYKQQAAELLSLQSQINPHFLYNTLETIYWETIRMSGKPTIVNKMLENLSDMLKYSLDNKEKLIKLKAEIENTSSYIEIQKYRYEDKFDVVWEVPPCLNDFRVKKLILQPLVENSIYHGIKEKDGKCFIKIRIKRASSHLKIFIVDNGIGIMPDRLKEIQQNLNSSEDFSDHIGLYNTNKRLKLTYGEAYGIKIRSLYGVGTVVHVLVPLENSDIP